jgi:NitT/TauT family transport system substrate-binding protein
LAEDGMSASPRKVKASMMNAIHDLPLLVARDEGFFRDLGLDVEILRTPGSGQRDSDHQALRANIFERTMESLYDRGECDQFRMCEWGVMKRAVEANAGAGRRRAKIVALGSAMSTFALVVDPKSAIYEPEQLRGRPIGVSPYNGSHFTTLKLLEGFLKRAEIKTLFAGTMKERIEALRRGEVAAASLMEPWISYAEKLGLRVVMESHSTRSEAAGEELDGPTLRKMFDAEAEAAKAIERAPLRYAHYLVDEAGGLLEIRDLDLSRIVNAPPEPYTRERFEHTYEWTRDWGLVPPGATYEGTVDNRAWQ